MAMFRAGPMPSVEVYVRAGRGDPLAAIEIGEWREGRRRTAVNAQDAIIAVQVFMLVVLFPTNIDSWFGRAVIAFQLSVLPYLFHARRRVDRLWRS